jgi:hypothetical protein
VGEGKLKSHDKYKPTGISWFRINTVGDKRRLTARSDFANCGEKIAEMVALIPEAEKEYDTKVELRSERVSHGWSNRDGDYTECWVTWFYLYGECYTYSHEDSMAIALEGLREKYPKLFKEKK